MSDKDPSTPFDGDMDTVESTILDTDEMSEMMTLDPVSSPPPSSDEDESHDDEVVEEEEVADVSRLTMRGHAGSAFCCCVSASGDWAVSGGEDDSCAVWRLRRGADETAAARDEEPLLRISCGIRDSVVQVAFNCDDSKLAVADMSGSVRVFDVSHLTTQLTLVNAPVTLPLVCHVDTESDLNWLHWHNQSAGVLLAGTADGDMWMWLVPARPGPQPLEPKSRLVPGHGAACTCVTVAPPQGLRAMLGYEDGAVRIVEMRSGETVARFGCGGSGGGRGGHEAGVTCVSVRGDGRLALSASEDGTVVLYRMTDSGYSVLSLLSCVDTPSASRAPPDKEDNSDGGVEQADFCPTDDSLMVTISTSGLVLVWDVTSQRVRHRLHVPVGASRLCWSPVVLGAGCCFYVGCLDASVVRVNAKSGSVEKRLTVRSPCHLLDMCVSSRSADTLVTALDDGRLCVFDLI